MTSWTVVCQVPLPSTVSGVCSNSCPLSRGHYLNYLILCCPLLLLPSIFPSVRVFSNESALRMRWPKYWSFSFTTSPSSEHPGLISFRMIWLDLLAVQGTLESLLQHHSSKASVLWHSAFFIVQLSYPYMTTGKAIALPIWTFVSKIMSLLLNMSSRFIIVILPRRKCLLIVHGAHLSSNTDILGFPRIENRLTLKAFFLMITNSLQTLSWNCETPLGPFFFMVKHLLILSVSFFFLSSRRHLI